VDKELPFSCKNLFLEFVEVSNCSKPKTATDVQTTVPAKYRIVDATAAGIHGRLGVDKCGRAGHAINDNTTRLARSACRMNNATNTHSENVMLIPFHDKTFSRM
jgi:hypothetical protein